jgi:hypothetical protein
LTQTNKYYLDDESLLNDKNLVVWFCMNSGIVHPKLITIPIGLASSRWPHGDIDVIRNVTRNIKPFADRKILIYVNFRWSNMQTRSPAHHVKLFIIKIENNSCFRQFVVENLKIVSTSTVS